jgi:hypothetical protein
VEFYEKGIEFYEIGSSFPPSHGGRAGREKVWLTRFEGGGPTGKLAELVRKKRQR